MNIQQRRREKLLLQRQRNRLKKRQHSTGGRESDAASSAVSTLRRPKKTPTLQQRQVLVQQQQQPEYDVAALQDELAVLRADVAVLRQRLREHTGIGKFDPMAADVQQAIRERVARNRRNRGLPSDFAAAPGDDDDTNDGDAIDNPAWAFARLLAQVKAKELEIVLCQYRIMQATHAGGPVMHRGKGRRVMSDSPQLLMASPSTAPATSSASTIASSVAGIDTPDRLGVGGRERSASKSFVPAVPTPSTPAAFRHMERVEQRLNELRRTVLEEQRVVADRDDDGYDYGDEESEVQGVLSLLAPALDDANGLLLLDQDHDQDDDDDGDGDGDGDGDEGDHKHSTADDSTTATSLVPTIEVPMLKEMERRMRTKPREERIGERVNKIFDVMEERMQASDDNASSGGSRRDVMTQRELAMVENQAEEVARKNAIIEQLHSQLRATEKQVNAELKARRTRSNFIDSLQSHALDLQRRARHRSQLLELTQAQQHELTSDKSHVITIDIQRPDVASATIAAFNAQQRQLQQQQEQLLRRQQQGDDDDNDDEEEEEDYEEYDESGSDSGSASDLESGVRHQRDGHRRKRRASVARSHRSSRSRGRVRTRSTSSSTSSRHRLVIKRQHRHRRQKIVRCVGICAMGTILLICAWLFLRALLGIHHSLFDPPCDEQDPLGCLPSSDYEPVE